MLITNRTPFFHGTKLTSRRPPQPEMTLVVRGTLRIVQEGVAEIVEGLDQGFLSAETFLEGDDERVGECIYPGDFADFKLSSEVMLRGTCWPIGGKPARETPVRFSVGSWKKELMVYGDRRWERGFAGARISEPAPFESMPLDWAHAFGGPGFAPNPVGKGHGTDELPNVEALGHLITARGQQAVPGTFAPVNPAWAARAGKRGTSYGADWLKKRAPYHADDFDWRFFSAAVADQHLEGFSRGDEEIRFHNLHPTHPVLVTRLPGLRMRAFVKHADGAFREIAMSLDTLFAEPDAGTIKLTWRGVTPVADDDLADVRTVLIASEPLADRALPADTWRSELEAFEKDPTGVLASLPAGMLEAFERLERRERGETVESPPPDPALDPLTNALSAELGPLVSAEDLAGVQQAAAQMRAVPGASQKLDEALAAAAARKPEAPSMRVARPGRMPPTGLRRQMRDVAARVEELRDAEGATGEKSDEIAKLEALPLDPRWKELDPTYEPPGPLSTDAPGPGADLRDRDLREHDLAGIDLTGANLEHADLTRANLRGARLRGAKLSCAVLYLADLSGADLTDADLTLANAAYVRAPGADFTGANLTEAFLEGADLSEAKLANARAEYALLEKADLRRARAEGVNLDHADLSKAKLASASLRRASAVLALFADASAAGADLSGADLRQASFQGADLSGAILAGAKAQKAFFTKARLDGAELGWCDLTEAHLTECSAVGMKAFGADLRRARLYRADLERAELVQANLMAVDARKVRLERTRLTGSNLYDAKLLDVRGTGWDLTDANLERARVEPRERRS